MKSLALISSTFTTKNEANIQSGSDAGLTILLSFGKSLQKYLCKNDVQSKSSQKNFILPDLSTNYNIPASCPNFCAFSTQGCISLTTLFVKHCNDLLDRQNSERSRNQVTCFFIGDVLCMPIFKKKYSLELLFQGIFFLKNWHYVVPRCIQQGSM